ncbi:MAG: SCP-2 sterol transfer family protein, partial [Lachnospiraceae bacterium]|nr:SCP-2 sterol transfer family protein [Lachnospiraceae bacterium]
MRINIYYGGRGLIEDATIYVMDKLTEVLEELRVEVVRYNLYEDKKGINILSNTIKEADGVILATSVEWFGIG